MQKKHTRDTESKYDDEYLCSHGRVLTLSIEHIKRKFTNPSSWITNQLRDYGSHVIVVSVCKCGHSNKFIKQGTPYIKDLVQMAMHLHNSKHPDICEITKITKKFDDFEFFEIPNIKKIKIDDEKKFQITPPLEPIKTPKNPYIWNENGLTPGAPRAPLIHYD
jgi:hypothetical protein